MGLTIFSGNHNNNKKKNWNFGTIIYEITTQADV